MNLKPTTSQLENDRLAFVALFAFAFGLRLIRLFDIDLIFDEVVLVLQSKHSYSQIWELCKLDNFPPLYPWLVKLWTLISLNPKWIRLLAALLSALTPPAAYLLGREIWNRKFAWLLGIALAISPCLMYWSQFIRMYNLQTFWVIISVFAMLRAMKTNQWRYWILMSFANLAGYYTIVFMVFLMAAQAIIFIFYFRLDIHKYIRPLIAHIPSLIGISLWFIPALSRFSNVQGSFWSGRLTPVLFAKFCIILGIGNDCRSIWVLEILMSLPIWIGFVLAVFSSKKTPNIRIAAFLLFFVYGVIILISLKGSNFFHDRYISFLLPIYFALVIFGWLQLKNKVWQKRGLISFFVVLALSLTYYYVDYFAAHVNVGFVRGLPETEKNEGHSLSLMAAEMDKRVGSDEIILHYSGTNQRIWTFYSSLFYQQKRDKLYLYSRDIIKQYNGSQYLPSGAQVNAISNFNPLPGGIWIVSTENYAVFIDERVFLHGARPNLLIHKENLPLELMQQGYRFKENFHIGKVSALHYRLETPKSDIQEDSTLSHLTN
jgi:hypothetical protein